MVKKISVFGGTGFIGDAYCDMFEEQCVLIPRSQREPETSDILYFISTTHNYNVLDNPYLDIETNLILLIRILEECKQKYNSDFVFNFVSSWFVYGKTEDLPANESSECNPRGFYSITKRAAEQLLISYCETFGIKYRIMRLCNVYGSADQKVSKKRNALQFLTTEVINNRDINLYDEGENIRDFLHVEDVCRALNLVIYKAPLNELINIGSGTPSKFIEIMSYVKEKVGSTSKFNWVEPPEFHKVVQTKDIFLDVTKLNNLGFKPKYVIRDGIDLLIKNIQDQ